MKIRECKVWKKTNIIDLPYSPFDPDEIARQNIINESTKHIRKIKNISYRENTPDEDIRKERRFAFYHTDILIGIDISALAGNANTYLDNLIFIIKMYPLVLINSYIEFKDSLKASNLHSYMKNNYYILPAFGPIPFFDKAQSGDLYGNKIIKLLKGEIENIATSDLLKSIKNGSVQKIKIRFPQLNISDDVIQFTPQITWIGVQDSKIEKLLNDLFNKNIGEFSIKEKCKEYELDKNILLNYVEKSMLFFKKDDDHVMFRLQRKYIYWGFVCNLAEQIEKEMIERQAICYDITVEEKLGTIKKIDEIIYHKLGNLFLKCDAFSYKMYSHIKRIFDTHKYSDIVVIDNGNMKSLVRFLEDIGLQDQIYEVLDYYGKAVRIPTTDYDNLKNKSVLVITDVINTGGLIESVKDLLNDIGCKSIGVFSFIVNQDYPSERLLDEQIEFTYLTEKKLSNVKPILEREYAERFKKDRDLNFKLLWGEIGKDISLRKNDKNTLNYFKEQMNILELHNYKFDLKSELNKHSYIYQKLERILLDIDLIVILKNMEEESEFLYKLILEVAKDIQIEKIKENDIMLRKLNVKIQKAKNILFFIPNSYVSANKDNLDMYFKKNNVSNANFFDIVEFEVYSLEKDSVIDLNTVIYNYIFQSHLKYFIGSKDNPIFDLLKKDYNDIK